MSQAKQQKPLLDYVVTKLRPFQREALEFATEGTRYTRQLNASDEGDKKASSTGATRTPQKAIRKPRGRLLLGDEMGLGKSLTALAIMAFYEPEWPLLIFCPASLKYTWTGEMEKWFPSLKPSDMYVAGGFSDVAFGPLVEEKKIKAVIISYSLLQKRSAVAQLLQGNDCHFQCVIADESHNIKERNSQRTQLIEPVLSRARRLVLLSGTPALARPAELWTQVSCLDPKKEIFPPTWTAFANRYCAPRRVQFGPGRSKIDYSGSSNLTELHGKLVSVMVRRLKADVLQELPPKQRSVLELSIVPSERAACETAMKDLKDKKKSVEELVGQAAGEKADFQAKGSLMKAYQQTGIGKAESVANYLLDWLAGTVQAKVLVFCHHAAVMDKLDQALLKHYPNSHIRIDGSVNSELRAGLVHQFQTVKHIRVGLLSVTAAGVGLTLTAASTVMFAELHWTPGILAQAEDRAHRIGQVADSVQIVYLVCRNEKYSVDGALWKMLGRKIATLDQVVDGKKDSVPYLHGARESPSKERLRVPTQSVTQEVAAFFAAPSTRPKPVAVKGSIQSFFQKAAKKTKDGESKPDTSTKKKAGAVKPPPNTVTVVDSPPRATKRAKAAAKNVAWACDACTFENSESVTDNGWYECQMCSNPYQHHAHVVPKLSASHSKLPPVDIPSDDEDRIRWTCATCTTKNSKSHSASGWYSCISCEASYMPPPPPLQHDPEYNSDAEFDALLNSSPVFQKSSGTASTTLPSTALATRQPARVSMSAKAAREVNLVEANKPRSVPSPQVINLTDSPTNSPPQSQIARARKQNSQEVVVLDDDNEDDDVTQVPPRSRATTTSGDAHHKNSEHAQRRVYYSPGQTPSPKKRTTSVKEPMLLFSISKHTGTVTIHDAATGESSLINFVPDQVVTADVAAQLLQAKVQRHVPLSSTTTQALDICFDEDKVQQVVERLPHASVFYKTYARELKAFCTALLHLRAVERKVLAESGRAFAALGLAQQAAQLLLLGGSGNNNHLTKVRYGGGAKERAREAVQQGTDTTQDQDVLLGTACAWCAAPLTRASRRAGVAYCSQECAETGRLRRGGRYASAHLRQAVLGLEGGVCTVCGVNARALFEQVCALKPPERLNKLLSVQWRLPKSKQALENLLQDPTEGSFWQVDHIQAVAEGGGDAGLENLRTLCVPCHLTETEKLHKRLALQSPDEKKDDPSIKRRQVDIRSAFAAAGETVKRMKF